MKNLVLKAKVAFTLVFIFLYIFSEAQVKTKLFKDGIPAKLSPTLKNITKEIALESPREFKELKSKLGDTLETDLLYRCLWR